MLGFQCLLDIVCCVQLHDSPQWKGQLSPSGQHCDWSSGTPEGHTVSVDKVWTGTQVCLNPKSTLPLIAALKTGTRCSLMETPGHYPRLGWNIGFRGYMSGKEWIVSLWVTRTLERKPADGIRSCSVGGEVFRVGVPMKSFLSHG